MSRELWPEPDPCADPGDYDSDLDEDYAGLGMHWDERIDQECPAGGPHVATYDSSHPDRMFERTPHCDECGVDLPIPQQEEP